MERRTTSDTGTTIVWTEDDERYLIASPWDVSQVVELGNDMEALDLATWRARVGAG